MPSSPTESGSPTGRQRILCVDDELGVLRGLRRLLKSQFEVDIADSGQRGLEILTSQGSYDVILSDMRMPHMTGIDFLNQAWQISPLSARVLLTGQADIRTVSDGLESGVILTFMLKPFESDDLRTRLDIAGQTCRWAQQRHRVLRDMFNDSVQALQQTASVEQPWSKARAQRVRRLINDVAGALGLEAAWRYEFVTRVLIDRPAAELSAPTNPMTGFTGQEDLITECREHVPTPARDVLLGNPRLGDIEHLLDGHTSEPTTTLASFDPYLVSACAEFDRRSQLGEQPEPIVDSMAAQDLSYSQRVLNILREHHSLAGYGTWDEDTEVDIGPLLEGLLD